MAECLGLDCYYYNLGQCFGGQDHSEEVANVRAEHAAANGALRSANIKPAECPFNTRVTLGDIADRGILPGVPAPTSLVSGALAMQAVAGGGE